MLFAAGVRVGGVGSVQVLAEAPGARRGALAAGRAALRARSAAEKAEIVSGFVDRFGAALAEGRIAPVIDRVLPLAEAAEGHRVVKASEHFGKVVLRVA